MAKTNKSISNRIKITRNGKMLVRIPGKNHFNAKASRAKQLRQKGWQNLNIAKKQLKRYLPSAAI
ncbi:hypothetical protein A2Z53_00575 [Candidatus Giovannonibacteria bacterium RIFCSPHIGHO2_02_42_15]|uniref:50S ribosomal protein L35 n=1 Tax=Candidatus Giovannonibacteria bacterium RIFCSPHIGHO2_02_42_15 TaxID=1798329 RepID=A0A1F5VLR0_9BACT|nr:MAG: hypothetical protein A2Z53_00575 [Candidatus Giovannonibacteria bacterium RIFCSPHIGHO2_02_42_15]